MEVSGVDVSLQQLTEVFLVISKQKLKMTHIYTIYNSSHLTTLRRLLCAAALNKRMVRYVIMRFDELSLVLLR